MSHLERLEQEISALEREKGEILETVGRLCWKKVKREPKLPGSPARYDLPSLEIGVEVPATPSRRAVPEDVRRRYQQWYSAARAIVSRNQRERLSEFDGIYADPIRRTGKFRPDPSIRGLLSSGYLTENDQLMLCDLVNAQADILTAVPRHIRGTMYDVQLTAYAELMDDELGAARELLKSGFCRPAGALAGVILERHLKNLLRKRDPPVRVPEKATLSKVNDICKDSVYDAITWRKVQHLTDIRNLCVHEKGREPSKEEVRELIDGAAAILKTCS